MRAGIFKQLNSKEYFLVLLPLFFVFHGYAVNFPLVSSKSAVILFAAYSLSFLLFAALVYLVNRNWRKTALFTFFVMCSFFFFGSFHDLIKKGLADSFIAKYTFLVPLLIVLYLVAYYLIKRSNTTFQKFVGYLNILLIVLILLDAGQLLLSPKQNNPSAGVQKAYAPCDTCTKPDIYFIIADEYIGNKTLKEQFGFDNTPFENELRKRGFHIVLNSISNYNYTPYSIASILDMNYLDDITSKSNDNKNRNISYKTINKNTLTNFLSSQGYSFVNHSLFDIAHQPTEINSMFFLTKDKLITHQTLLGRLDRDIRFNLVTRFKIHSEIKRGAMGVLENNQKLINDTYATLKSEGSSPKFIYTHLMMPHYPYYFDQNGKPYPLDSVVEGNQINKHHYIEYLQYCNKRFLTFLDSIVQHASRPPIIVFMGDHGFRHFTEPVDRTYEFLNLNAVYLPNKNYQGFYEGMSAVNQFRVIFNNQFNQAFPLLKDSTIYLKEY